MSILIEVVKIDNSTEVVTLAEAETMRANGELAPAPEDTEALTLEDVYGSDYESSA